MPTTNSYGRSVDQILALKHPDAARMRAKFMSEMRDLVQNSPTARAAEAPLDLPDNARLVALCDMAFGEASELAVFAGNNDGARRYFEAMSAEIPDRLRDWIALHKQAIEDEA